MNAAPEKSELFERRVLAVPFHEEVGGAVDVEVGGHHFSTQS